MNLVIYTREPIDSVLYDPRLAYSMHLGYSRDGKKVEAFNHNSGVLFAKATENADGSLNPMSLQSPYVFQNPDGSFGVIAVRILADGGNDASSKGSVLVWKTKDFLIYEEMGLLPICDSFIQKVGCKYDAVKKKYVIAYVTGEEDPTQEEKLAIQVVGLEEVYCFQNGIWDGEQASAQVQSADSLEEQERAELALMFATQTMAAGITVKPEGMQVKQLLQVPEDIMDRLHKKLVTPENIGVAIPENISVSSLEELNKTKIALLYSDGTRVERSVDWDTEDVDFSTPGVYEISGEIKQKHFPFPIALNKADPCIAFWEGKYYFIATHDADHEHTMYIREADTMEGLVDAEEHLILDSETFEGIGGLLWAPEFHEIEGRLYIFHAATPGEFFYEECRIRELREGGNPICKEDWSAPKKILKKDGTPLCEEGRVISLDMTCFPWEGDYYVIWSQREFLPKDLGAWLYIAKLDPKEPHKLLTDPYVLSKPDYGWGNNHTFVEEGPFALIRGDKLYITFSAAAVDTSYVVSYLETEKGKDLLDAKQWRKNNYPILTSRSVEGEFGTGHNAYVEDEEGFTFNTYHARLGTEGVRSSGVRRVHFDIDGAPMLDVTEELDLKPEFKTVICKVTIE